MEDPNPSSSSSSSSAEKQHLHQDDNKTAQCSVISIYQTKIAAFPHNVTIVWSKNLINHSLSVTVDNSTSDGSSFSYKVDLKPWPFWSKKGFKTFEVDNQRLDLFWDLRSAKYTASPEPSGGYYVALVCNEEVILLLGDSKKEAYKKTKSRPTLEDAVLLVKRENVFGKKCFTTRARFDERAGKKEHDIVVENSISGPKEPEMWISIDGVVLIHVSNLQWKFRGNETVLVEQVPVQIFWDVYDWLYGTPGSGHALFIFKPGAPQKQLLEEERSEQDGGGCSGNIGQNEGAEINSGGVVVPEFCFFLYALEDGIIVKLNIEDVCMTGFNRAENLCNSLVLVA